jgi:hypothetical protein
MAVKIDDDDDEGGGSGIGSLAEESRNTSRPLMKRP